MTVNTALKLGPLKVQLADNFKSQESNVRTALGKAEQLLGKNLTTIDDTVEIAVAQGPTGKGAVAIVSNKLSPKTNDLVASKASGDSIGALARMFTELVHSIAAHFPKTLK